MFTNIRASCPFGSAACLFGPLVLVLLRSPLAILVAPLALFGPLAHVVLRASCSCCCWAACPCRFFSELLAPCCVASCLICCAACAIRASCPCWFEPLALVGRLPVAPSWRLCCCRAACPCVASCYLGRLPLAFDLDIAPSWRLVAFQLLILLHGFLVEDVDTRNAVPIDPPLLRILYRSSA